MAAHSSAVIGWQLLGSQPPEADCANWAVALALIIRADAFCIPDPHCLGLRPMAAHCSGVNGPQSLGLQPMAAHSSAVIGWQLLGSQPPDANCVVAPANLAVANVAGVTFALAEAPCGHSQGTQTPSTSVQHSPLAPM